MSVCMYVCLSATVRRLLAAVLARSSREISQTDRILFSLQAVSMLVCLATSVELAAYNG